jgi:uncharacterized membrane protein YgdD (TMEM256/DUF423 family)
MRPIFWAAGVMFMAVALGAFGAHALQERLQLAGKEHVWETAVLYQAIHGLALLGLGIWQVLDERSALSRALRFTGVCWIAGVFAFSGSLYALSLGGPKWLGPITPLGGLCFMVGWIALAIGAWKLGRASRSTPA